MERQVIKSRKRWTEKFFKCKDLNKERGIKPDQFLKEGFWEKPNHNELDKEFRRQNKLRKADG